MSALKAFANSARTTLWLHSREVRQDVISKRNSERSLTEVLFARMEFCRARCTTRIGAVHTRQRFSIPFGRFAPVRPLWHLACRCHVVGAMKCLEGHMANIIEFYIP